MLRNNSKILVFLFIVFVITLSVNAQRLDVVSFIGSENSGYTTSYILTCGKQSIIVDPPMSVKDIHRLADTVKRFNRNIIGLFITDAYPDHFLGISETKKIFPNVRVMSTRDVASEITRYGMDLYDELNIRKLDDITPRIILPDSIVERTLTLERCKIEIHSYHSEHAITMTVLYDPNEKSLFTSDLVYNRVHPLTVNKRPEDWLGQLDSLKKFNTYMVYPGHGAPTNFSGINNAINYFTTFQQAARTHDQIAFYDIMNYYFQDYQKPANLKYSILKYGEAKQK